MSERKRRRSAAELLAEADALFAPEGAEAAEEEPLEAGSGDEIPAVREERSKDAAGPEETVEIEENSISVSEALESGEEIPVFLDTVAPEDRLENQLSEEELREFRTLKLQAADGSIHSFLALANVIVNEDRYLILQPTEGEEGYYQILPYELSQSDDQPIEFRDFRNDAEFESAYKAAMQLLSDQNEELG